MTHQHNHRTYNIISDHDLPFTDSPPIFPIELQFWRNSHIPNSCWMFNFFALIYDNYVFLRLRLIRSASPSYESRLDTLLTW